MLDTRLGDLFRFNQEYLLHNQVPDAVEVQESMSLCILVRIQKPDGSETHSDIIADNSHLLTDDNLDDLINSTFYKLMFTRCNEHVWLPEYKFIQMFEPLIPPRKKINKLTDNT